MTAVLLYQRLLPPKDLEEREAWGHIATPEHLRNTVVPFWTQGERYKISARLSELYKLRVIADYKSRIGVENDVLMRAIKEATYIVKRVQAAIPVEK